MKREPALSHPQVRLLTRIGLSGGTARDAVAVNARSLAALLSRGLVDSDGAVIRITESGKAALDSATRPAPPPPAKRAPTHVPVYSTLSTIRRAPHYSVRRTVFLDLGAETPVRDVIAFAVSMNAQRVVICGDKPLETWWYLHTLPPEWKHGNHFLTDPLSSTGRYFRGTPGDPGRRIEVEICRATPWFGDAPAAVAERAWLWLAGWLGEQSPNAQMMSTPVTTGRDLWRRLIPAKAEYPILSDEVRQLVHATSPQHRRELIPQPEPGLLGFAYLDMRLAYAACAWGLGIAPGEWVGPTRDEAELVALLRARGRYRVRAEVPKSWGHVGILPHADASGGWEWPCEGGRVFETWCDASEAYLALQQGWRLQVIEGFTMREGKPLNGFTDRITATVDKVELAVRHGADGQVGAAIRSGLRAMFVGLIGGFAQRGHEVWRSAPIRQHHPVPAPKGVMVRRSFDGKTAHWVELQERTDLSFAHPEWSSAVWARARNRLLDSPGIDRDAPRVGALHLPRSSVLAFAADALYLDHDPGWPDDGQRGRFRRKGGVLDFVTHCSAHNVPLPGHPADWKLMDGLRAVAEGKR